MTIRVLVPDLPERRELEGLPVEVVPLGKGRPPDDVLRGIDVLVVPWWRGHEVKDLLPAMERLRLVQTMTAGVEGLPEALPPGVVLCDAAGVHDVPVAEWVLGAVLALQKGLPAQLEAQRRGRWERSGSPRELAGSRALIVGYGSIGRAVEARLVSFGVEVDRVARRPREEVHGPEALPELLPHADVVLLLLPLTSATRGIVDERALAAMRDEALIVNAGRGGLIDTEALLVELRSGRLRAALDTTDPEPLPPGHPLWSAPNVLITPHLAGASPRLHTRAFALVRRQLERLLAGESLANVVEDEY